MNTCYIIIDKVDNDELSYKIYRFNPEESLKPEVMSVETDKNINKLISIIEDIISDIHTDEIYILGNDEYIRNVFDNDIKNYSHIKIVYDKNIGYKVKYISPSINNGHNTIYLLDTSASGILKYIEKIKHYF